MKRNLPGNFTFLRGQIQNLTVLGLDPSLSSTGLVVWNGSTVIAHCLKKTTTKNPTEERIEIIRRSVMVGVRKYNPDLVVIEGHAYNSRSSSLHALHELHGVIKNSLWKSQSAFTILPPQSLKAYAVKGGCSKEEMIEAAETVWPRLRTITGKRDDLADACHLARWGWDHFDSVVELVA